MRFKPVFFSLTILVVSGCAASFHPRPLEEVKFMERAQTKSHILRSCFKIRILVQGRGGAEFKTAGNHQYFENFKRGTNPAEKGARPKDNFETASNH